VRNIVLQKKFIKALKLFSSVEAWGNTTDKHVRLINDKTYLADG
jgi:hypothetical protein